MKSTLDVIWRSQLRHAQEQDYREVGSISAAFSSPVYVLPQEISREEICKQCIRVFMYAFLYLLFSNHF